MTHWQRVLSYFGGRESNNGCPDNFNNVSELRKLSYDLRIGISSPASEFFRRNVNSELSPDTCWMWSGARLKHRNYGVFYDVAIRRTVLAHRRAWEVTHGPIPAGQSVLHRCDNPPCCNPAHLFLGTQLDNMRDMARKGRRSRQAHAPKGRALSIAHRAALSAAQQRRHAQRRRRVG
jgi:hypothetical protein